MAIADDIASPPPTGRSSQTTGTPSSFTNKNPVVLSDWWLTELETAFEGKKLGVSGFTIRKQVMRLFNSAAIVKRFDAYNLETADGVSIMIQGVINKERTCVNGFSVEVCNNFLVGFPCNWEYYATEYFQKKSMSKGVSELDPTQTADTWYPAYPVGLSTRRICNWFSSAGGTVTEGFKNELEELLTSTPIDPLIHTLTLINNPQNVDTMGPTDAFHGDVSSNTVLKSCGKENQHEELTGMLMKTHLQSRRETEVTSDLEICTSVNHGDFDDIQRLREEELTIGSVNPVVTGNTGVGKSRLHKELDIAVLKDKKDLKDATERQHDNWEMETCKTPSHSTIDLLSEPAVQHDAPQSGIRRSGRVLASSIASRPLHPGDQLVSSSKLVVKYQGPETEASTARKKSKGNTKEDKFTECATPQKNFCQNLEKVRKQKHATERQHDNRKTETCKTPSHSTNNILSEPAAQHDAPQSGIRSGRALALPIASRPLPSGDHSASSSKLGVKYQGPKTEANTVRKK